MKTYTMFAIALCLLAVAGAWPVGALASGAASNGMNFQAIDRYVTAGMQAPRIPGLALAIVKGDQVVYLKGYGQADPSGRPVTPQTPFLIGSISKPFTALAVMQLVEAGKLELEAPVQKYLPWFRVADPGVSAQITVRQLLTMTSGISPSGDLVTQAWTADDNQVLNRHVRLLADSGMDFPPGKSFEYNNANYVTLGAIVQAVAGQPYEDYIRQHIFAPLAMHHSFVSQDAAVQNGMATGYRWWFGLPVATVLPYNRSNLPAGYIISSAEDMAHFLIAQMNGGRYGTASVLSPDGIALTHRVPVPGAYGMGWESVRLNGRTLINHDGGNPNFQASLFFDPEERVGVFMAANVINALDTFSSPSGASALDGPTLRAMAESVLNLATNRPLPDQGPGIRRLTIVFDLVLLGLTAWLVIALVRVPGRYRRLARRGLAGRAELERRSAVIAALHFVWPLLVLYLALASPAFEVYFTLYQPDLGYWLDAVAMVVFLKGWLELALLWRVYRQTQVKESQHAIAL